MDALGGQPAETESPRRGSRRKKVLIGAGIMVVIAVGGAVAAFAVMRGDTPSPASLDDLPAESSGGPSVAEGSWSLVADGTSFVGYRVRERVGPIITPGDAVGRTTALTGELVIDGDEVTAVSVTADMTKLTSNVDFRDDAMRGVGLETDEFKEARFELTEPIEGATAERGEILEFSAVGDLTLHGVTKSVEADIESRWNGGYVQVAGSIPITLSDFDIDVEADIAFAGLHVDGRGIAEFELVFAPTTSTDGVGNIDSLRDDPTEYAPFDELDAPCTGDNTTDGAIVFGSTSETPEGGDDLWRVGADGSGLAQLTDTPTAVELDVAVSPDGTMIAYSHIDMASGIPTVWVMKVDGSGQRQLIAGEPLAQLAPAWSPDGSRLVFSGGSLETPWDAQLYSANADGTDVQTLTTSDDRFHGAAAWSPDGRTIAFESYGQEGADELFTVPATGGDSKRLTDDPAYDSSPEWLDGDNLVFSRDGQLATLKVSTGTVTPGDAASNGYGQPRVSPDAETLLLTRNGNLYTATVDGQDLTCLPAGRAAFNGDWLPG